MPRLDCSGPLNRFKLCRSGSVAGLAPFAEYPHGFLPALNDILVDHDLTHAPHGRKVKHGIQQRSEEHTSELQSLMRISYAVFCLKKKITVHINRHKSS